MEVAISCILNFIFFKIYEGFLNCLKYINKELKNPKIFIGENGFPENEGVDESVKKVGYHSVSIIFLSNNKTFFNCFDLNMYYSREF